MTRLAPIALVAALGLAPTHPASAQQAAPATPQGEEANLSRPDRGTAAAILAKTKVPRLTTPPPPNAALVIHFLA